MRAGTLEFLRRAGKRLSGSLAEKQSGHFYVWTRAFLGYLERSAKRRPVAVGLDSVTLDALPARGVGARYRELEPPGGDVRPPSGWVWPSLDEPARTIMTSDGRPCLPADNVDDLTS
jgi:hypothetical protein